jgi:hypothetical protein
MATVYLPVEATIPGMTSGERATAINAEVWALLRPSVLQLPQDTKYKYPQITHPDTGQVAIQGDTTEEIYIRCEPRGLCSLWATHPVHLDAAH